MAKNKKNKQSQQQLTSEQYLRTRVRQLPIYKCYKGVCDTEIGEMSVVVVRQHPQGNFTFAAYLLDCWCVGVKNAFWKFNVGKDELDEYLDSLADNYDTFCEIEYVEAHNWVYGAADFAANAGINPCKKFDLAKYLLYADDDNVELIEYDFGKDGEYYLVAMNNHEASKYIPSLNKTLGEGNYKFIINDDYSDYEANLSNNLNSFLDKYKSVPQMEYSYSGISYPTTLALNHEAIEDIVNKNTEDISDEEIDHALSFPEETLREDLQNIIMYNIGQQFGKSIGQLNDDNANMWAIANSLMLLTKVGTVNDTLPVVLEVLRQNYDFLDFNFSYMINKFVFPIMCALCKDKPSLLLPFLLEEGLTSYGKTIVLDLLEHIGTNIPEIREELVSMVKELLSKYKEDLPQRTICDGSVTAFAIGIATSIRATELLPQIEELYATGLVDESVEGDLSEIKRTMQSIPTYYKKLPPMDPHEICEKYRIFVNRKRF